MEALKRLLNAECDYRMREETMEKFLELMTEVELKRDEPLIPYGKTDSNIYILKSGIIRLVYFDGFRERTHAFALSGTVMISYYPFYGGEPSFCSMQACCDSVVMKIRRDKFVELMKRSHDFAQWMVWISSLQLYSYERKLSVVNGDARERFEALIKNRPEIIEKVQMKIIASYIGVTPQYLSTIKGRCMSEMGK